MKKTNKKKSICPKGYVPLTDAEKKFLDEQLAEQDKELEQGKALGVLKVLLFAEGCKRQEIERRQRIEKIVSESNNKTSPKGRT